MILPEINAAIQSIKIGVKIAKGFSELKTEYDIKSATTDLLDSIIDVQNNLLSIQSSYADLLNTKIELEKKLTELEEWNKNINDYSLIEVSPGIFVFINEESQKSGNKQPWFCVKCFNDKKLSPLQKKFPNHEDYICHSCGAKIQLPEKSNPPRRNNSGGWMSA